MAIKVGGEVVISNDKEVFASEFTVDTNATLASDGSASFEGVITAAKYVLENFNSVDDSIADDDLFLIESTTGESLKITAANLKSQTTDDSAPYAEYKLLVNKSGVSKYVRVKNLIGGVDDDDLMLMRS